MKVTETPAITPVEPAWVSSRFWVTATTAAMTFIAFLVSVGIVASDDQENVSKSISGMIGALGSLAANAFVIWQYIRSRTQQRVEIAKAEVVKVESQARVAEADTRKMELIAAMPTERLAMITPKFEGHA